MVTYKTIVVPTDGSENAKRALEHALAVADRNHAELIVVHVANIGKEILNDVVKEIPTGVKVKSVFEVGSPGPALLAVAKKYNADLIVMGSRGLGPLKGLFMGSVSSYVTSHSTCPVLIIK